MYSDPRRRAIITTRTTATRVTQTWKLALGENLDYPVNPSRHLPAQEIMIPIEPYEWSDGIPKNAQIMNLEAAEKRIGKTNSDIIQIGFGRKVKTYPVNTLLFVSYEMENVWRYARYDHQIVYRFIVAPAYLANTSFDFNVLGISPFNFEYSSLDGAYMPIKNNINKDATLYQSTDFESLFPWGATI